LHLLLPPPAELYILWGSRIIQTDLTGAQNGLSREPNLRKFKVLESEVESGAPRKAPLSAGAEDMGLREDAIKKWEGASRLSPERALPRPRDGEDEDEAEETTPMRPDVPR